MNAKNRNAEIGPPSAGAELKILNNPFSNPRAAALGANGRSPA